MANYLPKRLDGAGPQGRSLRSPKRPALGELLGRQVQEVIGIQHLIIMDYLGGLLSRLFQEAIQLQRTEIVRDMSRLPPI